MAILTADTDIVFIVDTSGSMYTYIDRVKNSISNFADSLSNENVSFRLGLIDFGDYATDSSRNYYYAISYDFFENVEDFKNTLTSISWGSADEYGLNAIQTALNMDFREGVTKRFIMLTDEGYEENNSYSYSDLTSETIVSLLNDAGVVLDVVGVMDGYGSSPYYCQGDYEPIANATGGNFYDIDSLDYTNLLKEIAQEILVQNNSVYVNLNDVGEGQTGVFIVNQVTNSDGTVSVSSVATFKAAAEEGDIVVGNVTEPNVYVAEAESEYRQNITIPENWNATGTNNDDILRFTGNNATATGSAGNDRFYVSSGVNNATFGDFTPSEDSLSFASQIPENSLYQSMIENALVLSNDNINLTFKNTPNLTTELAGTTVSNGGVTNTISELIAGATISDIVVDPDAPVMMSLSHWSYGFYPPTE